MEVVLPSIGGAQRTEVVGSGKWSFQADYVRQGGWPVKDIKLILASIAEKTETSS